jgi:hypothetical protein
MDLWWLPILFVVLIALFISYSEEPEGGLLGAAINLVGVLVFSALFLALLFFLSNIVS